LDTRACWGRRATATETPAGERTRRLSSAISDRQPARHAIPTGLPAAHPDVPETANDCLPCRKRSASGAACGSGTTLDWPSACDHVQRHPISMALAHASQDAAGQVPGASTNSAAVSVGTGASWLVRPPPPLQSLRTMRGGRSCGSNACSAPLSFPSFNSIERVARHAMRPLRQSTKACSAKELA
jgi:hypothetical protein